MGFLKRGMRQGMIVPTMAVAVGRAAGTEAQT